MSLGEATEMSSIVERIENINDYINYISRVSCQKGPICQAQAWREGSFWQDTIDM